MILLGGSAVELQQRTQQLQGWSEQRLLFCADVEEGVGQRFEGASWLVPPLALGVSTSGTPSWPWSWRGVTAAAPANRPAAAG